MNVTTPTHTIQNTHVNSILPQPKLHTWHSDAFTPIFEQATSLQESIAAMVRSAQPE
jgi:hypothetical protein